MSIVLRYGKEKIEIPSNLFKNYRLVEPNIKFEQKAYRRKDFKEELLDFLDSGDEVSILVSDITRYTACEKFLKDVILALKKKGIKERKVKIVFCLGIHRKLKREEMLRITGPVPESVALLNHDPNFTEIIGKTSKDTPISIYGEVLNSDKIILTGRINFHYFAGFSGGRKSILPGVASKESCTRNHLLVITSKPSEKAMIKAGVLYGNPVHEDMMEALEKLSSKIPIFLINTVLDSKREILDIFFGDPISSFYRGCEFIEKKFSFQFWEKGDLVVASCGGYPYDINFIQAHKTIEFASYLLKDGADMIVFAKCDDGIGHPTFLPWFGYKESEFEEMLHKNYEIYGQTAYSTYKKTKRFNIYLFSSLDPKVVKSMGMYPISNKFELKELLERFGSFKKLVYIFPFGQIVLPKKADKKEH